MGKPKPKPKKGQRKVKQGLLALRQTVTFKRPHRERRKPSRLLVAIEEEDLLAADPDIDVLVPPDVEYDDDNDWLPNVPGRPSPFTTTWEAVYGHRSWSPLFKIFLVGCQEGCGRDILLNGKLQEVNGGSTPHGKPRRPPVCHNVSWAALEVTMLNMEGAESRLRQKPAALTSEFVRAVCWEPSNLRPGHNACNALGTKTTAQNVTKKELLAAEAVVDKVRNAWPGSIWKL